MNKVRGFSTMSVHSGEPSVPYSGSVTVPIFQTATFGFDSTEELVEVVEGRRKGYIYTRYGNPTIKVVEDKIACLEGGEAALAFSSGMAAISSTMLTFLAKGSKVVSIREVYGGTFEFLSKFLPRFGVDVTFVKASDTAAILKEIRSNCDLLYLETPTNPLLDIVDLEVVDAARSEHIKTVIDNTFATPINQRPISYGVDLVVHSTTKYMGGHSDIIGGVTVGSKDDVTRIWSTRKILGGVMDPHAAWLLLRGLKTLALRVERQNTNAQRIAEFLEHHSKVSSVYYPGLASHPSHEVAAKQMKGYGGVVSFVVKGGFKEAATFVDNFELGRIAPSLGGVETLVTQPVTTSHYALSPEERRKAGITDNLIRISVGIEDQEDLIPALDKALEAI